MPAVFPHGLTATGTSSDPVARYTVGSDTITVWIGSGDPNGTYLADKGSIYHDTSDGSLWKKTTDSSNINWVNADEHFANSNLTATNNRSHDWGDFTFAMTDVNTFNVAGLADAAAYSLQISTSGLQYTGGTLISFAVTGSAEYFSTNFNRYKSNIHEYRANADIQNTVLRLLEIPDNGTGYVDLIGPDDVTTSYSVKFPNDEGAVGEALTVASKIGSAITLEWSPVASSRDSKFFEVTTIVERDNLISAGTAINGDLIHHTGNGAFYRVSGGLPKVESKWAFGDDQDMVDIEASGELEDQTIFHNTATPITLIWDAANSDWDLYVDTPEPF